ncbi:MAG: nucleotidyltransferase domain-containing protein [Candidatus Methylomirabilales bacterium]
MIADKDRKIAEALKDRLLSHNGDHIKRVILYGSRATGGAGPHSDFDLLVVEAGPVSQREEMVRLRQALGDLPYAVDVWVMSEEEFEETKHVIGGLAYPAHNYGLVLHENP